MRYLAACLFFCAVICRAAYLPVDAALLPPSPPLLRSYGERYLQGGQPQNALRCAGRLQAMGFSDSSLYYLKARALYRLRRYREASLAAAAAGRLDPSRVAALVLHGAAAVRCGDFRTALPVLRRAVQLDRDFRRGWMELGRAYFRLSSYSASLAAYRQALRCGSGFYALAGAGRAAGRLKAYAAAVSYLALAERAGKGRYRSGWVSGLLTAYRYREAVRLKRAGQLQQALRLFRAAAKGQGRYRIRARRQLAALGGNPGG